MRSYQPLSISADLAESSLGQALVELGEFRLYVSKADFQWAKGHFKGAVILDEELRDCEWYIMTTIDGKAVGSKI